MNQPKGEAHVYAKLSESTVRNLRKVHRKGSRTLGTEALAVLLDVSPSCISKAVNRRSWRHI